MKFNCGITPETERTLFELNAHVEVDRLQKWHQVFAFWPVQLGECDCRWLEWVWRRYPNAYFLQDDRELPDQVRTGTPQYRARDYFTDPEPGE